MTTSERVQPFSNGTEWGDWDARNCERCTREGCDLLRALFDAGGVGDGTIAAPIAARLKCGADGAPAADCPERVS